MTKRQREIVGRCAIGILGLLALYGAYKCFAAAVMINGDLNSTGPNSAKALGLPVLLGIALSLLGLPLALAAIIPTRWFEKWMGRQRNNSLWENPASDSVRHWGDLL